MKRAWIGIVAMVLVAITVLLFNPIQPTSHNTQGIKITEIEFDGKIIEILERSDSLFLETDGWIKQELYYPITSKDYKWKLLFELTGEIQIFKEEEAVEPIQVF